MGSISAISPFQIGLSLRYSFGFALICFLPFNEAMLPDLVSCIPKTLAECVIAERLRRHPEIELDPTHSGYKPNNGRRFTGW